MQTEKEEHLHRLAKVLLEHETLTRDDVADVLAGTFDRTPVVRVADPEVESLLGESSQPLTDDGQR